jgi:hypothetical protein
MPPGPASSQPGISYPGFNATAPALAPAKPFKPVPFETIFAVSLFGVAAIGASAAGVWYLVHKHYHPISQPHQQVAIIPAPQPAPAPVVRQPVAPPTAPEPGVQAPTPTSTPDQNQLPTPSGATPVKPSAIKPSPGKPSAAKTAPAKPSVASPTPTPPAPTPSDSNASPAKPVAQPTPAPPAAPHPASTAFDPRKLDPNTNAKLKIDLGKFPNGLAFSVEMGRQPYLQFVTGDGANLDNLYVPPGVQQFRVTLKSGGQEVSSNIASEDFKAKKKKTLKIQLMEQGNTVSKITLPLSKDAQLFLSISTPLF